MANNSISVAVGDDLFRIATKTYGDPAAWTLIASANGLSDPIIQQDATLIVPDYNSARAADGLMPLP
jgi:nucleoid-associated protein YgaU